MNLFNIIYKRLELENYCNADIFDINGHILEYLMGTVTYMEARGKLDEYYLAKKFLHFLRNLSQEEIYYVIKNCKRYAKCGMGGITYAKYRVHRSDRIVIRSYIVKGILDVKAINLKKLPTLLSLLSSLEGVIYNKARSSYYSLIGDKAIDIDDLRSDLKMKAIEVYRTYVFNYGLDNFNIKVFYSCIVRSLSTKCIDLIRRASKDKRKVNVLSKNLSENVELILDPSTVRESFRNGYALIASE
jgi:hypothetical protein